MGDCPGILRDPGSGPANPTLSRHFLCSVGPGPGQKSAGQAGPGRKIADLSRPVPCPSLVPTVSFIVEEITSSYL